MGVGCEAPGPARLCYPGIELQPCSVFLRAEVRSTWTESVSCAWIRTRCVDLCCEDLVKEDPEKHDRFFYSSLCLFVFIHLPARTPASPVIPPPSSIMASELRVSCFCCLLVLLVLPAVRSSFHRSGVDCGPGRAEDCPGELAHSLLTLEELCGGSEVGAVRPSLSRICVSVGVSVPVVHLSCDVMMLNRCFTC